MIIFNSYVSLPEGICRGICWLKIPQQTDALWIVLHLRKHDQDICHTHRFEGNNPVDDDENGHHGADVPKTHHGMFQIYKS